MAAASMVVVAGTVVAVGTVVVGTAAAGTEAGAAVVGVGVSVHWASAPRSVMGPMATTAIRTTMTIMMELTVVPALATSSGDACTRCMAGASGEWRCAIEDVAKS